MPREKAYRIPTNNDRLPPSLSPFLSLAQMSSSTSSFPYLISNLLRRRSRAFIEKMKSKEL